MSGCEQEKHEQAIDPKTDVTFVTIRGIAKEVFAKLGGGEASIMAERAASYCDARDDNS